MKKYVPLLKNTPLFSGTSEEEISAMLHCLNATVITRQKGSYIIRAGEHTGFMGLVLEGCVLVIQEDIWGHRNIMDRVTPGESFAESYAASKDSVLNISAVADTDCRILSLDINRVLSVCPTACSHHNRVVRNLVSAIAQKNLKFNEKITHMSKRSTKEKLLSYLSSESQRQGSLSFTIPYDRQQLADYLCVERAAMSAELSKLQKAGLLEYNKNHFVLSVSP